MTANRAPHLENSPSIVAISDKISNFVPSPQCINYRVHQQFKMCHSSRHQVPQNDKLPKIRSLNCLLKQEDFLFLFLIGWVGGVPIFKQKTCQQKIYKFVVWKFGISSNLMA